MGRMKRYFLAALALASAAGEGSAATLWVINPRDPPGARCALANGWHYDRYGHHLFGPYRLCVKTKPTF